MIQHKQNASVRNSSIEFLRIISINMVIILHYISRSRSLIEPGTVNFYFNEVFSAFTIIGVNCFVLITGYFCIQSNGLKLRRIVDLLFTIAFWSAVNYIIGVFTHTVSFTVKEFIVSLVPYVTGGLWFFRVYIVMLFLSPFLNVGLNRLTSKQYLALIVVLLCLFSIWPSFLPNPIVEDGGYGIVHFVVLYIIGGFLKLHYHTQIKRWVYLLVYVCCSLLSFSCLCIGWPGTYGCYNFIFNIVSACALFMFFSSFKLNSKLINAIASTTFGIYIIHEGGVFSQKLYYDIMQLELAASSSLYVIYMIVSVLLQFVALAAVVYLQKLLFRFTFDKLLDKILFVNKKLFQFNTK